MAQLSRTDLATNINNNVFTNTTQSVTAANVNQTLQNINDSNYNKLSDVALVGLKEFDITVTYTPLTCCVYEGYIYQSISTGAGPGAFNPSEWDQITTSGTTSSPNVWNGLEYTNIGTDYLGIGGSLNQSTTIDMQGHYLAFLQGRVDVGIYNAVSTGVTQSLFVGNNNNVTVNIGESKNLSVLGSDNTFENFTGDTLMVIGNNLNIIGNENTESLIIGHNTTVTDSTNSIINAQYSTIDGSNHSIIMGGQADANVVNSANYSYINGNNIYTACNSSIIAGTDITNNSNETLCSTVQVNQANIAGDLDWSSLRGTNIQLFGANLVTHIAANQLEQRGDINYSYLVSKGNPSNVVSYLNFENSFVSLLNYSSIYNGNVTNSFISFGVMGHSDDGLNIEYSFIALSNGNLGQANIGSTFLVGDNHSISVNSSVYDSFIGGRSLTLYNSTIESSLLLSNNVQIKSAENSIIIGYNHDITSGYTTNSIVFGQTCNINGSLNNSILGGNATIISGSVVESCLVVSQSAIISNNIYNMAVLALADSSLTNFQEERLYVGDLELRQSYNAKGGITAPITQNVSSSAYFGSVDLFSQGVTGATGYEVTVSTSAFEPSDLVFLTVVSDSGLVNAWVSDQVSGSFKINSDLTSAGSTRVNWMIIKNNGQTV